MGREWKRSLLNLVFPPLCIACGEPVAGAGFCADSWSAIQFLDGPLCACCGIPFDVALPDDMRCAACLTRSPAFDRARAILRYDDVAKAPILALKHADRLDLVPGFALWLERAGRGLIETSDLIMPVPLHPLRLWRRRYNQAAELARALSRRTGIAVDSTALVRSRATSSQGAMVSARARRRNVLGAFKVPERARVAGRNILVVDDVLTTGATAEAAARALKRAGAGKVQILALARVVRTAEMVIKGEEWSARGRQNRLVDGFERRTPRAWARGRGKHGPHLRPEHEEGAGENTGRTYPERAAVIGAAKIPMKSVTIYTTPICPYCARAKSLLGKKGAAYDEVDVMMDDKAMREMLEKSGGARSVPQIFIGDTYVGGCDELYALERDGQLDALLT